MILPILTLCCLAFIFANSLQNANKSSKRSSTVTAVIVETIQKVTKKTVDVKKAEKIVRKSAHFSEFALFSVLTTFSFFVWGTRLRDLVWRTLFCGLVTAAADEYLQSFSPGRAPMVTDVWIDFFGVILGFLVSFLICAFIQKRRKQRENPLPRA